MTDPTIAYYNENAKDFYNRTVNAEMTDAYINFLEYVKPGGKILDAGCGSGRDSLYFKNNGFNVTAFDASEEMVKRSSELIGQKVLHLTFNQIDFHQLFDGIWASASLLHVKRTDIINVISKLASYLCDDGVFYMSFKYGNKEYEEDRRYFNCYDEEAFSALISQIQELKAEKLFKTREVRPDREQYWLNCILRKNVNIGI
jgi:SAM-dependent methyltransferase